MNTYLDCVPCFLRQSLEAARSIILDIGVHERIVRDVLRMAAELGPPVGTLALLPPSKATRVTRNSRLPEPPRFPRSSR
jgi:hypothetical protein